MDIPYCWPSSQKMCILISYEEWRAVSKWDHWHERLIPLQTVAFLVSFLQKALFLLIKLSRQLGISSVLSSVHLLGRELAQVLPKGIRMTSRFHMEKEDATRKSNARSLRQIYPKTWTNYFKDLFCVRFPCRRAQGRLSGPARTVLLRLLVMRNRHIPSAQPSRLALQAPPSLPLTQWILRLPSSSSSPLWHWSETPTGHTVHNEIKTRICKDDAFLDSLIGQMLSWGSDHLSTQALPGPNRLLLAELLRERETIRDCKPKTRYAEGPPDTKHVEENTDDDVHGW